MKLRPLNFLCACAMVGCGGAVEPLGDAADSGTGDSGPVTIEQACHDQETSFCALVDQCTQGNYVQRYFGSMASCVADETAACGTNLAAPQSARNAAAAEACAAARSSESCVAWFDDDTPGACRSIAGPRADGSACGVNSQCASSYCALTPTTACGTCQPLPAANAPCQSSSQCPYEMSCPIVVPATTGVCTPYATEGSACDDYLPCQAGLACIGSNTAKGVKGTCQAAATTAGAACSNATGPGCDDITYLYCVEGKCQVRAIVGAGQPCDIGYGAPYSRCADGAACIQNPGTTVGTCAAAAANGAACDTTVGPLCLPTSKCITADGGTAGTCMATDPTSCG